MGGADGGFGRWEIDRVGQEPSSTNVGSRGFDPVEYSPGHTRARAGRTRPAGTETFRGQPVPAGGARHPRVSEHILRNWHVHVPSNTTKCVRSLV
jgi:hypothetical protein